MGLLDFIKLPMRRNILIVLLALLGGQYLPIVGPMINGILNYSLLGAVKISVITGILAIVYIFLMINRDV